MDPILMHPEQYIEQTPISSLTRGLASKASALVASLTLCMLPAVSSADFEPDFAGVIGTYGPSDFYVTDLAFDPDGNVFLANLLRNSVDKYDSSGSLLFRIEDPAFRWARTLTVDSNGRVYVVDNVVGNIRVYSNTDGSLLDVWTGYNCAGEIHADSNDRILVAMNGNDGCAGLGNEVRILDTDGAQLDAFGSAGSAAGQFDRNYGIATSADDSIFVCEVGSTARFQKFASDGTFQFQVGGFGSDPGEFNGPRSPAIDSAGNIYISDRRNDRIQKFDSSGSFVSMWGSRGKQPEQFFEMDSIEMGAGDIIWVAGYHKNDIQQFDTSGNLVDRWVGNVSGDGEFSEARGVGVVAGEVFVVDGNNNRVQVFDATSHVFKFEFGERAQGFATVFNFPRALATGPDGHLYIPDDDNIRRIRPDGSFVRMYPRLPGARSGSLGLAVSDDNIIYQSDNGNHRINKIDADTSALLGQWGSRGNAQGELQSPRGIALGSDDRVYVADTGNRRIQIFDLDGNYLDEWPLTSAPRALAIDRIRDIVYVGEWGRILAYDYDGVEITRWNSDGTAGGRFQGIYDIALGNNNEELYISEVKRGQVQHFIHVDTDTDGEIDLSDNCRDDSNPDQADFDGDGSGDACDTDDDEDGVLDLVDAFPLDASETLDSDADGVGDNADAFPLDAAETADSDGDGVGDNADAFPNDPARSEVPQSEDTVDTAANASGEDGSAALNWLLFAILPVLLLLRRYGTRL